jgi:chondroitin sulfate synthase
MYDHYGDQFEYFMRADDDLYVRTDRLAEFLRSIDSKELHFIGQAGRGSHAEEGSLNLANNENFCMGGPGILFSLPALAKVVPHVTECLKDMYSTHEDVEIGRCVHRFADISCSWAYEMQTIFYHNSSGESAFTESLKQREVHRATTLHPVKDFRHLYRLHSYFQSLKIQELLYETILLHRDLQHVSSTLKYQDSSQNHSHNKHVATEDERYNISGK